MNWIDTNTLITICTCAIGLTQFILWKHIAKVKAYEAEKGKNLATKEDIAGITKEIESVKASYNESLERHKIELQKEFEEQDHLRNVKRLKKAFISNLNLNSKYIVNINKIKIEKLNKCINY